MRRSITELCRLTSIHQKKAFGKLYSTVMVGNCKLKNMPISNYWTQSILYLTNFALRHYYTPNCITRQHHHPRSSLGPGDNEQTVASTAQMPATNNCLCIFTLSSLATNIYVSLLWMLPGLWSSWSKKRKNKEKKIKNKK